MTRTLGSGLAADIAVATAEATELIELQFADAANNPTPLYLTTAAQNLVWNAQTWIAVGGRLEVDALGESTDLAATTVRLTLAGVDQTLLALILGSRWRGRTAKVYYAHLSQTLGTVIDAPVVMFVGLMNGGFSIVESRGDFGGGTVDVSCRITEKVNDLVRVRGVRTNVASHQSVIPGV